MFPNNIRFYRFIFSILVIGLTLVAMNFSFANEEAATTQTQSAAAKTPPAWIQRSNENAEILLNVFGEFNPEFAGQIGVEGLDEQIIDLQPGLVERSNKATEEAIQELRKRLAVEKDPLVKQDLEILIKSGEDAIKGTNLTEKYQLQYFAISQTIFSGLRALLDNQIPAERRNAALVRLKRYAGMKKATSRSRN